MNNIKPLSYSEYYSLCVLVFAAMLVVMAVWYLYVTWPAKKSSPPDKPPWT